MNIGYQMKKSRIHSEELVKTIIELVQSKKAENIVTMDLRELSDVADFFIICTGTSSVQIKAIADEVREKMKHADNPAWHVEGYEAQKWILLDFVDVILHVFNPEARNFYSLERIWADADINKITDNSVKHSEIQSDI